jgi:hypothetical protein
MSRNLRLLLAGTQAGMAGAILMLGWLAVAAVFYRHTPWWVPNLYASTFAGDAALREHFTRYTWSGVAFLLVQYTLLGSVFAFLLRQDMGRGSAVLLGILTGVGWYFLMFHGVWKALNPLMLVYTPDRSILAGHILYGLWLGRTPLYARRLE